MAIVYTNYRDYTEAYAQVQKINQRLYGFDGYGNGLDDRLFALANTEGESSPKYKAAKAEFDKLYAQLDAAKKKLAQVKADIDSSVQKEKAAKAAKENKGKIADLEAQKAQAVRTNNTELAQDYQDKIDALKGVSKTDDTSTTPEGEYNSLDAAGFGKNYTVVYDPQSKSQILVDGNNNPIFVYTDSNNAVKITDNFSEIQKNMIADAKAAPGGLNGWFADLYERNLISPETFKKKDLMADDLGQAMVYIAQEYSKKTWGDYTYGNKKESTRFLDWLDSAPKYGSGAAEPTRRLSITLRQDANKEINQFFINTLGRPATAKEKEDYFAELNAAERKAVETTRSSNGTITTTGKNLTENDKLFIKGKIAGDVIKGTDVDVVLSNGGDAAENVNTVLSYANRNGIAWTKEDAMAAVADAFRNGKTMDNIKTKIKGLSKFRYANLSPMLAENDDIDIYDLGQSYGALKAQILELGDAQYSVFDSDIQAALNNNGKPGLMTETEFRQMLKQKPEWRKTKNAREEAANYANDILRSFGLVG